MHTSPDNRDIDAINVIYTFLIEAERDTNLKIRNILNDLRATVPIPASYGESLPTCFSFALSEVDFYHCFVFECDCE
jgi:hypothetical protein